MLWNVHPNRALTTVSNVISRPIFSPDGQLVAAGIGENKVAAWDVATLQLRATFADAESAVGFSSDGSALLTRGTNYFLRAFDVATRTVRKTILRGPGEEIGSNATLSPDGQILVATLHDGTLTFSDAKTGVIKATASNTNYIFHMTFSPNGKLLAAACGQYNDKWGGPAAQIWDVLTHKLVAALTGHTAIGLSVGFSPDGKTLATSSADNSIRFWDTTAWKEIPPSLGQKEYVPSLAFSPNGRTLATACADDTMRLWNAANRRELASLKLQSDGRNFVFSSDGQALAVWITDGSLRLWRAPIPDKKRP